MPWDDQKEYQMDYEESIRAKRCWKDTANSVMESFINLQQKVAPKTYQNIKRPSYTKLSHMFSISFYNKLRDAKFIKFRKVELLHKI